MERDAEAPGDIGAVASRARAAVAEAEVSYRELSSFLDFAVSAMTGDGSIQSEAIKELERRKANAEKELAVAREQLLEITSKPKRGKGYTLSARISAETRAALEAEAERSGRSMGDVAERWIDEARRGHASVEALLGGPGVADTIRLMVEFSRGAATLREIGALQLGTEGSFMNAGFSYLAGRAFRQDFAAWGRTHLATRMIAGEDKLRRLAPLLEPGKAEELAALVEGGCSLIGIGDRIEFLGGVDAATLTPEAAELAEEASGLFRSCAADLERLRTERKLARDAGLHLAMGFAGEGPFDQDSFDPTSKA